MIAIIDYRAGNLTSVARAVRHIGFDCSITCRPEEIAKADRVIFPGVGSAQKAMADLKELGLDEAIRSVIRAGKPVLGICLGTQIIFDWSAEGDTLCLGILPGKVVRFPDGLSTRNERLKIPHMGWNRMEPLQDHFVFTGIPRDTQFYFVHSYYPEPAAAKHILGLTDYGISFASAICKENLVAVQFHPEKSGRPGLNLLENFCKWSI
ncbi:MAG: imidazole glycerol phosphate synthase subunit HisH [Dissulfuribacterales bacterium]